MRHEYAQTILQLLAQLRGLGYPQPDLERVRRAADLANELFGAKLRGSGKPFSAHLIGTASILARYGGSAPTVLAAVLHAAYAQGEWGDGATGATPDRRQALREVLGDAAEHLVHRYSEFRWRQPGAVAEHARSWRNGDAGNRNLLLMRLANELEEYLDFGNLYAADAEDREQFPRVYGPYMIEIARAVGVPELGAELAAAFAADEAMQVPPSLRAAGTDRGSEVGSSCEKRPHAFRSARLLDYIERHASERPDAVAIDHPRGPVSWAALLPRVAGIAQAIVAAGDGGRPVASLLSQANMPLAMLAALRTGRVFAPISTDYPADRRRRILEALEPGCLLVDDGTADLASAWPCPIANVDGGHASEPDRIPDTNSDSGAPAIVVFTSGSTGEPIGVVHSEANLLALARRSVCALRISPADRLSMLSRGIHVSGITDMVRSFVSGATLVPCDVAALGIDAAADAIRNAGVTVLHCTPSLGAALFRPVTDSGPFDTVRLVHFGGEALPSTVVASCRKRLPTGAVVVNQLGCTELSGFCQAFLSVDAALPQGFVAAGYPVDGVAVRILDERGRPVARGETGQIEVSGDGLALGYWNAPERTAAAFRETTNGGARRFLTGDRGRWLPDGQLEHRGRADRQVQVRGYRVELAEVETALRKLDMIADATVLAPAQGTEVRIVAHVVPAGETIDLGALHALLGKSLPPSMLPNRYQVHERLPRTPTGKVDRLALEAIAAAAPVTSRGYAAASPHAGAPGADAEEAVGIVASVWADVLGHENVGEDDDFFMIGGDSLLAMRICSRLASRLRVDISLRDFFEAPTPRQFAQRLRPAKKPTPDPAGTDGDLRSLIDEIEAMPIDEVRRSLDA